VAVDGHRADDGQVRELVTYSDTKGMWRWFLAVEGRPAQAGWAPTKQRALVELALAKNPDPVPHITRRPRPRWVRED
jgi:hypothetical protein